MQVRLCMLGSVVLSVMMFCPLTFDGSHFRLCETPGEQGECWANIIVVTKADEVLVKKLAESHSEVIIMHINVEEVEDEMEPIEGDQQSKGFVAAGPSSFIITIKILLGSNRSRLT